MTRLPYTPPLSRDTFTAHGHLVSLVPLPTGECVWSIDNPAYEKRGCGWDIAPSREAAVKKATEMAEMSRDRYEDWST